MPDWFYRTVARPVLFHLPDRVSRRVALGVIGTLGNSRAGRAIIDFLGHMDASQQLATRVDGVTFCSPIGLGWRVDPERRATRGLSRFGVGYLEQWQGEQRDVVRHPGETLCDRLTTVKGHERTSCLDRPILLRCRTPEGAESIQLPSGRLLPVVAWDAAVPPIPAGAGGIVLQVGRQVEPGLWRVPAGRPEGLVNAVAVWRTRIQNAPLVVSGGVSGPEDALALIEAGADLLLIDAGLVFRGPGLVKRCNEALLTRHTPPVVVEKVDTFRQAWWWAAALGLALTSGGVLTLGLAATRVLLPYDEHYIEVTSQMLRTTMPRLFAFMAHDRGTLAGTMLGLGWLYGVLAYHGVRRRVHGAKTAVVVSALSGFASFFAFFGFGYFDTLHAFVAAILFQLTVQVMVGAEGPAQESRHEIDFENSGWRRARWGQLLWIVHAVGLLIAGLVILGIGMTSVMVKEDLSFLCLTESEAQALGPRLLGVVAHDRATLGGMLLASGVGMLLPLLWCFNRGQRWLWKAIAGLGLPAYGAAFGVHFWVGYTDWRHLVPALFGLILWVGGLYLSSGYLKTTRSAALISAYVVAGVADPGVLGFLTLILGIGPVGTTSLRIS